METADGKTGCMLECCDNPAQQAIGKNNVNEPELWKLE
jgi:hypothetical protein